MKQNNGNKNKWIWLVVLLLFIVVCISVIVLVGRLNDFMPSDEGAIELNQDEDGSNDNGNGTSDSSNAGENTGADTDATTEPVYHPSMSVSDEEGRWTTNTEVALFHIFYEDGEQQITVQSDDGDNVIAPGTENSYTFKLKNTGDVALDYTVTVDAYVTPADITIPVTARLQNRYNSEWVVGGQEDYADVVTLDQAKDTETIGAGKYTYYTLDWVWPFESGDDAWDTNLGDMAEEQDITFTLSIQTVSYISENPDDTSGLTPPQTGDDSKIAIWYAVALICIALIILLVIYQAREKRRARVEARCSGEKE